MDRPLDQQVPALSQLDSSAVLNMMDGINVVEAPVRDRWIASRSWMVVRRSWRTPASSMAEAPASSASMRSSEVRTPCVTGTATTPDARQVQVVSHAGAVPIVTGEEDLAGAQPYRTHGPVDGVEPGPPPTRRDDRLPSNGSRRTASMDTTTHCRPNLAASSETSSGRTTAAEFTATLSAARGVFSHPP